MNIKRIALGAAAYTLVTFPLAILWHVVFFKDLYEAFGYFQGAPSFLLGFLTILIQGVILSGLYPLVALAGSAPRRGLKFAALAACRTYALVGRNSSQRPRLLLNI